MEGDRGMGKEEGMWRGGEGGGEEEEEEERGRGEGELVRREERGG